VKKVNKTRFAVLGMLLNKPQTGYEILQMMQQSTANFWQESDASIYPMLKKLEKEGKVTSRSASTGRRERTIFTITPTGKKEFLVWMALPPEEQNYRSELLLKLFFGGYISPKKMIQQLELRLQKVEKEREHYQDVETTILGPLREKDSYKLFGMLTLKYGVWHADAEIAWLNECIRMLEKK